MSQRAPIKLFQELRGLLIEQKTVRYHAILTPPLILTSDSLIL